MNGYIQININGQPIGIKFSWDSTIKFYVLSDKKPETYQDGNGGLSILGTAKVIHLGYLNNCAIKEVEPNITLESIYDWVESSMFNKSELDQKEIEKVLAVFAESVKYYTDKLKGDEGEAKKKTSKKPTSKLSAKS